MSGNTLFLFSFEKRPINIGFHTVRAARGWAGAVADHESPAGRDTGTQDVVGGPEARDRNLTGTTLGTLPSCLPASWAPHTLWRDTGCSVPSSKGSR